VSDTISADASVPQQAGAEPDHDHAWRPVRTAPSRYGAVGEYRCDLCSAVWSM
jgi:hypothetical protein